MNVVSVRRKVLTRYHTKSGASVYLLIMCSLFLLCNCNNPGTLSMAEQGEPQCGFFPMGAKCTPEYLNLWKDNRALGERLDSAMAENRDLGGSITNVQDQLASCTSNYEKLNQTFSSINGELSRLKNPYTFTQRDAYVGVGGAALGAMGLWVCQKMLGTKNVKPENDPKTASGQSAGDRHGSDQHVVSRQEFEALHEKATATSMLLNKYSGSLTDTTIKLSQAIGTGMEKLNTRIYEVEGSVGDLRTEVRSVVEEVRSTKE